MPPAAAFAAAAPLPTAAAGAAAVARRALPARARAPLAARLRAPPPRAARGAAQPAATAGASQYDQLARLTTIVEDTGEIQAIEKHRPFAATTNPTLVAKAADLPEYADVVAEALAYGRERGGDEPDKVLEVTRNCLFTRFGARILEHVPGDVSTEVDARLSFDVDGQVATAHDLIRMYAEVGVPRERVLIKLATTWEGVQACRILQAEGINTNMTLLFNMAQAIAAAEAGAYLISPFVGRVMDWYKAKEGVDGYAAAKDPGVLAVRDIYNYYKCHGWKTIVMGASFRNSGEILQLAGCDRLTISPSFIDELKASDEPVEHLLQLPTPDQCTVEQMNVDEKTFRWMMNQDEMATHKLHEGIRGFAADLEKLDAKLRRMIAA